MATPSGEAPPSGLDAADAFFAARKAKKAEECPAGGAAPMETDAPAPSLKLLADSASMQGRHPKQEDRHVKIPDLTKAAKALKMPLDHLEQPCALFCVYDGHQGPLCSDFVAKNFHLKLLKRLSADKNGAAWTDERIQGALTEVFEELDSEFLVKHRTAMDGCTAVATLLVGTRLFVAWVGNCRCLLGRCTGPGEMDTVCTTEDHRPMIEAEGERVKKAGGILIDNGFGYLRVAHAGYEEKMRELRRAQATGMGVSGKAPVALDVSRALGDRAFKAVSGSPQLLIPTPSVKTVRLEASHKIMALVAGGVPNSMMNDEVVNELDLVRDPADLASDARQACGALVQECYKKGSEDNLTVILVRLQWPGPDTTGYKRKGAAIEKAKAMAAAAAEAEKPKETAAQASKRRRLEASAAIKAKRDAAYQASGAAEANAAEEARAQAEFAKMRAEVSAEKVALAKKAAEDRAAEEDSDITGDEKEVAKVNSKAKTAADEAFLAFQAKKRAAALAEAQEKAEGDAAEGQAEGAGLDAAEAFFAARKGKKAEPAGGEAKGLDAAEDFFAKRNAQKAEAASAGSGLDAADDFFAKRNAKKAEEAAKKAEEAAKQAAQEAAAMAKAAEAAAAVKAASAAVAAQKAKEAEKKEDVGGGGGGEDDLTFL